MFNSFYYQKIKQKLKTKYSSRIKKRFCELEHSSLGIKKLILENIDLLKHYHDLNWFFLTQIEMLLFVEKAHLLLKKEKYSNSDEAFHEFSPLEEELFDLWSQSEFSDLFLHLLNNQDPLLIASQKTLHHVDKHLATLFRRHWLKKSVTSKNYLLQTSLGEGFDKSSQKIIRFHQKEISFDEANVILHAPSPKDLEKFQRRITLALSLIKEFSPKSFERFSCFTTNIIPINDRSLVSYSHQNLPRFSMINLYHRDFIDLLDDLLHENGHHHLNFYLNLKPLLLEPEEKIYYSPWRKSMRPLRGIYHAYFTFFWAFQLFLDLTKAIDKNDLENSHYKFTKKQKEKIQKRMIEEFHLLNAAFSDLKKAKKNKLIFDEGWLLIQEQHKILTRHKKFILQKSESF